MKMVRNGLGYRCTICTAAEQRFRLWTLCNCFCSPFSAWWGLNFDQSKIRRHLLKCFQRNTVMPFPQTKAAWPPLPHLFLPNGDLNCSDTRNIWWYGRVWHVYYLKCVSLEQFQRRSCVSSGGVPTPLAHRCSWWWKISTHIKVWS